MGISKRVKKAFKIIAIAAVVVYFIGNVLPNLIGVPLAAYHSYQAWSDSEKTSSVFHSNTDLTFPHSIGTINDFSQVFTASQRNDLAKTLYDYETETTRQIVIVTVDSIAPYSDIQKLGTDLANEWGVGTAEKNNGLVIILCKPLRNIGITTGIGTELILTDEICKKVIDHTILPEFTNENYYVGIKKGVSALIALWE